MKNIFTLEGENQNKFHLMTHHSQKDNHIEHWREWEKCFQSTT